MNEHSAFAAHEDKQSEASTATVGDVGHMSAGTPGGPFPHELTAEWTVRAQLTFARAGEQVKREYSSHDPVNPVRVIYKWTNLDEEQAPKEFAEKPMATATANRWSRHSTPLKPTNNHSFRSTTSSMAGGNGADSAFSGSNTGSRLPHQTAGRSQTSKHNGGEAPFYGTRCRSTCNIVVSAVADFLPPEAYGSHMQHTTSTTSAATDCFIPEEEADPFVFNTTASYTVLPEKSFDDSSAPVTPNPSRGVFGRVLALVDAFCQTSDTETKYFEELEQQRKQNRQNQQKQQQQQQQRKYRDEGSNLLPSYTPSPTQTFKSASLPRIPPLSGAQYTSQAPPYPFMQRPSGSEAEKKPRTVHIDVYCTGSEEDEQADNETSSSSNASEAETGKHYDMESNSTPQTVLDNAQLRLRHRRVSGQALPRRLAQQPQVSKKGEMALGHAITKSSTAEEVTESKQLLFHKHVDDQRAAKLQLLRQKYMRQASEDALSSNYANSSRSTMRDATCSSISSAVPCMPVDVVDSEDVELASYNLAKSDSFEYENSMDRVRIKRMERFWSKSLSSGVCTSLEEQHMPDSSQSPNKLQTIAEGNSLRTSPFTSTYPDPDNSETDNFAEKQQAQSYTDSPLYSSPTHQEYIQQTPHFLRHKPGFLQFFGPSRGTGSVEPTSAPAQLLPQEPTYPAQSQRWRSEVRDVPNGTLPPTPPPRSHSPVMQRATSEAPPSLSSYPSPLIARRFEMHQSSPASVSEVSTAPSGYTPEYLEKARKFGSVVAARKPGHHIGPTKNPNCSCESCQRWLGERFQIRNRAFSLGERPLLKRPDK